MGSESKFKKADSIFYRLHNLDHVQVGELDPVFPKFVANILQKASSIMRKTLSSKSIREGYQ